MPYAAGNDPNNADSTPDTSLFGGWTCDDWMTWYNSMQQKYGADIAKQNWLNAWNNQSFWATDYSWCKYDSTFNSFLSDNKIFGESNIVADTITTTTHLIGSVESALTNAASTLNYLLPGLLIVGAIILLVNINSRTKAA
jgi:hypothetical protein